MTEGQADIDWTLAQGIFRDALNQKVDARIAFARQRCGDDAALLSAVLELLQAADKTGDEIGRIIDEAAAGIADAARAGPMHFATPQVIGPYRILKPIGSGGMGQVFLAERDDQQFQQKVAIKVLATRFVNPELLRRFRTERQILANLNHPNIARLLDGGETDDGLPYLVMEYVEGQPLLEYCENAGLGLRARLALFGEVCDAVQNAHQNFVIHRDIKSSNVIVATDGTVKLLDFGIAKLLQTDLALHTVAETVADARLLTPANASPEQLRNGSITTATDVYGLGLLLYELLTGHPAFELANVSRQGLEEAICETVPSRPSERVTQSTEHTATTQGDSPAQLRRSLIGDLDTIVLKALRKEPERRYSTVRELAEDIERYLSQQPIRARSESLAYRSRKFIARNRSTVIAAVSVVAVSALLILFYTDQVTSERDRADLRAQEAEQTSQFLISMLNGANRMESSDGATVDELLAVASERVETELADVPQLQSKLHFVIADAYNSVEDYEKSFFHHEKALEYLRALEPTFDDEVEYSRIAQSLSILYREHGDYEESETLSLEVLALNERLFEPTDVRISLGLNKHGQILHALGRYEEARDHLERAVEVALAGVGEQDEHTADAMNNLAIVYTSLGDNERTGHYYERALAVNRAVLPASHPNLANSIANYGIYLNNVQRYEDAQPFLEESLAIRRQTYAGVKSRQVAVGAESLGINLTWQGKFNEASTLLHEALSLTQDVLGPTHPTTARRHRNVGRLYYVLNDYERALAHYLQTEEILIDEFGTEHPSVFRSQQDVGRTLLGAKRYDEAFTALMAAYTGMVGVYGTVSGSIYPLQKAIGDYYLATGDLTSAERYYQESLDSCDAGYGPDQPCQTNAMLGLATIAERTGDTDARFALLNTAIRIREAAFGPDNWFTAEARLAHCEALQQNANPSAAQSPCNGIDTLLASLFGEEDARTQRAMALAINR